MSDRLSAKEMVAIYFRMWNTGDLSFAEEILSQTFTYHSNPLVHDLVSLRSAVLQARQDDPRLHIFVDSIVGDRLIVTAAGRILSSRSSLSIPRRAVWAFRFDDAISDIWRQRSPTVKQDRAELG